MTTTKRTIDFGTMRVNCIEIHQQCYELGIVAEIVGIPQPAIDEDELKSHEKTKTWDGMGRYAKEVYDNTEMWDKLPKEVSIVLPHANMRKLWKKKEAREMLLRCHYDLGGATLYN